MKDDASHIKFSKLLKHVVFCTLYIKRIFANYKIFFTLGISDISNTVVPCFPSVCAHNLRDVFLETVAASIKRLPRVKMTPISPAYTCFLQEKDVQVR